MKPIHLAASAAAALAALACAPFTPVTPAPGASGGPVTPTGSAPPGLQPTMTAGKAIPVGKSPHGITAAGDFVYNSNPPDATISVIDARTDAVVKTIPVPGGKPSYAYAYRDKYVLVLDTGKGEVLVFDPGQDHKLLQAVPVGPTPDKIRLTAGHTDVLVSLTGAGKALVQLTFGDDMAKPPARKDLAVGTNPGEHRALDVEGGWALAPNAGDNNATLINLADGSGKTLTDGNAPGPVGIGATAAEVAVAALVGNTASNTVTIFDIPDGKKTTLPGVGLSPTDIVVHPKLGRAFVTMAGSNELAIVDYLGKQLVARVGVGARPVHAFIAPQLASGSPAPAASAAAHKDDEKHDEPAKTYGLLHEDAALSNEIWVSNDSGDSVTVVDGATGAVKATIAAGKGHHKMAFARNKVYVSAITDGTVSVIDRTTLK